MKLLKTMKRKLKDESGQALAMALIMLVLGGLLVVPTLSFMTTNLTANRIIEEKTEGIYAADAGIADALWKLGNGVDPFENGNLYDLTENVNGMTVTVDKKALDGDLYTLRSTATSTLDGKVKAVIIAQAVAGADFSWLLRNAITSGGNIEIMNNNTVYGPLMCQGDFSGNPEDVHGTITQNAIVKLPTEAQLTTLYLPQVDSADETPYYYPDHGYGSDTYNVSGGTLDYPVMIPAMYRKGNLSITGSGYAKLSGTIFLARNDDGSGGRFLFSSGPTLDLNGQTIYATGNSGCTDCNCTVCTGDAAIDFPTNCKLQGPGCLIAVGNIHFMPNLGVGSKMLGADETDTGTNTELQDRFILQRFQSSTGRLGSIQVKCYFATPPEPEAPAHVKVAIYADNNGAPGTCLWQSGADNVTVSSWHPVSIPPAEQPTIIGKKPYCWLAAIADADIISKETATTSDSKYKTADFDTFTFVNNPSGTFQSPAPKYQIRGLSGSQEFIFLMSICCQTWLQPNSDFYGSIAGKTLVHLQPNHFINLTDIPEEGLNFIGASGGTGGGSQGHALPLINYNIQ